MLGTNVDISLMAAIALSFFNLALWHQLQVPQIPMDCSGKGDEETELACFSFLAIF